MEYYLGIGGYNLDSSVAIVRDGEVLAHVEEERFTRIKHAPGIYPSKSIKYCLDFAGISLSDIKAVGVNWDLNAYTNGSIRKYFSSMGEQWKLDNETLKWQNNVLSRYNETNFTDHHQYHWRESFGNIAFPPIYSMPHHYVHAGHAFFQSEFDQSLCITIDGSGETQCTVLWDCRDNQIRPIYSIQMPHSLGWFYAAFTEFLGFKAYSGEYKVMGLAAYGKPDKNIKLNLQKIIYESEDKIGYYLNPKYIHYGSHTWSKRFTDDLVRLLDHPKRLPDEPITNWHQDLAFSVQEELEKAVCRLVEWGLDQTNHSTLCISGGVGLNIKMNSALYRLNKVKNIYPNPLCNDSGAASGAALMACWNISGIRPKPIRTLALGPSYSNDEIIKILTQLKINFFICDDVINFIAKELTKEKLVAWFQGRMEAGPRALGYRSILADPRSRRVSEKINKLVKYREYWRPFCPAILSDAANIYLKNYTQSPFMTIAFDITEKMMIDAPAVVHIDKTARAQIVEKNREPFFYELLLAFKEITGVPILLNTSFNVKGEPIVCSVHDAIRTFFASGLDLLVCGNCLVYKNNSNGMNN